MKVFFLGLNSVWYISIEQTFQMILLLQHLIGKK